MARIVITGASGRLGQRASRDLTAAGHEVVGLCLNPDNLPGIERADLRNPGAWMDRFAGAQAVIHLAAYPLPRIGWAEAQENAAMTRHALEAARRHGVRRFVFASSNWVMAGHRFADHPIAPDLPVHPLNPYGVSKYVGEELGRAFAAAGILEFVALRIGYLPADGRNGPQMFYGAWGHEMWLAHEDFCAAVHAAALAPLAQPFVLTNLVSRNRGTRWPTDAAAAFGFAPRMESVPRVSAMQRLRAALARASFRAGTSLARQWTQRRW